jgi:hypothetical protein
MFEEPLEFFFTQEDCIIESTNWSLSVILGFAIDKFYGNDEFVQRTEKQLFVFSALTKDILQAEVRIGDIFTFTNEYFVITFQVSTVSIEDFTGKGLSIFKANFISKEIL